MTYHSYDECVAHFQQLADKYPDLCKYMSIGQSVDWREIPCLIVGNGSSNVLMEGCFHGDEWSASEMVYMWADHLIDNQDDPTVDRILRGTKQYCIPISNPDGHVAHTRKNSNGVDCNRNWDSDWCGCGSSTIPSSPIYKGPHAFSEPETTAYRDLLNLFSFKRAVSWHAGTELLMYPWGYTYDPPPDKEYFQSICDQVNDEIMSRGHPPYRSGQISTDYPEKIVYPDEETLEEDLKILGQYSEHKLRKVMRVGPRELVIYCCSGNSGDYYYMNDTFAWVLEVSNSKTPPYDQIPGYFKRQIPLQTIVSLDAIDEIIDDTKNFTITTK